MSHHGGISAPAAERNKQPILDVLKRALLKSAAPDPSAARRARGEVLEIASGTGQHAAHFAAALPALTFQPSEPNADMHDSIAAWIASAGLSNVRTPIVLDVSKHPWPVRHADAIVCINMIHIAPWQATLDLLRGAGEILSESGVLFLYGPYRRFGAHTAPSNEAFDADLRSRNPAWGIRDLEAVEEAAKQNGLALVETVAMPANNFSVVFRKA